jgi:actin-related protein
MGGAWVANHELDKKDTWISKKEYQEKGAARVIREKCALGRNY